MKAKLTNDMFSRLNLKIEAILKVFPVELIVIGITSLLLFEPVYERLLKSDVNLFNVFYVLLCSFLISRCFNSIFKIKRIFYYLSGLFLAFLFIPLPDIEKDPLLWLLLPFVLTFLLFALPKKGKEQDNASIISSLLFVIQSFFIGWLIIFIIVLCIALIFGGAIFFFKMSSSTVWDIFKFIYPFLCFFLYIVSIMVWHKKRYRILKFSSKSQWVIIYALTPLTVVFSIYVYGYILESLGEMPRGGVAYVIFAYTMFTIWIKAISCLFPSTFWAKYFKYFSFISIPALVLFWVGATERVFEYGLTPWRVFLVVSGILMTISLLLFAYHKVAKYRYIVYSAALILFLMIVIPPLRVENLVKASQTRLTNEYIQILKLKDSKGNWDLTPRDSVKNEDTLSMIRFIKDHIKNRMNSNSDYSYFNNSDYIPDFKWKDSAGIELTLDTLSSIFHIYQNDYGYYYSNNTEYDTKYISIRRTSKMKSFITPSNTKREIIFNVYSDYDQYIDTDKFLKTKFNKIKYDYATLGLTSEGKDFLKENASKLLYYETDSHIIFLKSFDIKQKKSSKEEGYPLSSFSIDNLEFDAIIVK